MLVLFCPQPSKIMDKQVGVQSNGLTRRRASKFYSVCGHVGAKLDWVEYSVPTTLVVVVHLQTNHNNSDNRWLIKTTTQLPYTIAKLQLALLWIGQKALNTKTIPISASKSAHDFQWISADRLNKGVNKWKSLILIIWKCCLNPRYDCFKCWGHNKTESDKLVLGWGRSVVRLSPYQCFCFVLKEFPKSAAIADSPCCYARTRFLLSCVAVEDILLIKQIFIFLNTCERSVLFPTQARGQWSCSSRTIIWSEGYTNRHGHSASLCL